MRSKVQQDSTYQTGIKDENGMQSSYMPDAFISAIKEMNEGDVEVVESTKVHDRSAPSADQGRRRYAAGEQ